MDYFSSIFSGGFSLPYELGERHALCWGKWQHFRATRTSDKKPFSLFRLTASPSDALTLEAARNGVKKLRTTRHPRVLSFEWTGETTSGGDTVIYLVTEPVTPLPTLLEELALDDDQRVMYLALGLRQAAQAVAFLANQCKLMHGNVCTTTVLVTPELDWKLGFLDMASEHAHLTSSLLARCGKFVGDQYKPAELARGDIESLAEGPPWSVDAWGLGCLMQEVFSGKALEAPEQLRELACVPKEISSEYQKLLSQNPARRLNPNKLSDSEFLKNDLIDTVHTLENLGLREPLEKTKFFRNLPKVLPTFPPAICTRKLLPLTSAALEYGGAPALALGSLLQIGKMLGDDGAFRARVVPILSALFASPDHTIRNTLISNINDYAPFLDEAVVEGSIFPQLLKGLQEPNAYLREQTLKAMLPIAPKLSQRTLSGTLLKHLARLQVDPEPSIRANTTVLLGNIASLLGEAACKRILLNAFTRALRDVFPASRIAAIKALMATAAYHSAQDVAGRVVPAISPMMLDTVGDVRSAACKAMEFFMRTLVSAAEAIDKGIDPNKAGGGDQSKEAKAMASNVSSFLGWAMSSISLAATSSGATPQKERSSGGSTAAAPAANGARRDLASSGAWDGAANGAAAPRAPPVAGELSASGRLAGDVDTSSLDKLADDAWGGSDDWGDLEVPAPTTSQTPTRAKPKPKLVISKKRDGKGD